MSGYYSGDGLGLGKLGAAADRVPTHPLGSLGQAPTGGGVLYTVVRLGGLLSVPVLGYHGYKRNDSVGGALLWGILGSIVWPITVPIAFAQGFGKRKVKSNRRRRSTRRRTSRRSGR